MTSCSENVFARHSTTHPVLGTTALLRSDAHTPESAIGGPLALVETGDRIRLDVGARRLDLLVPENKIATRRERWSLPPAHPGSERGYLHLFLDTVTGADRGCDFDFMGRPDASVPPAPSGRPAPGD